MEQLVQNFVEVEHIIDLHIQHMMVQDVLLMINQVEVLHVTQVHAVRDQQLQSMVHGVVGEHVQKHVEQEHKQEQEQ